MGRRNRRPTPVIPFEDAKEAVTNLESAVMGAMVSVDFTLQDVADAFVPQDSIEKLKAAFPHSGESHPSVQRWLNETFEGIYCHVRLDFEPLHMCTPLKDLIGLQPGYIQRIRPTISAMAAVHVSFNKVRAVVDWLNENATPGAARYYWPTICALLPADHVVQQLDGQLYREPVGVSKIIPLMRETSAIVAGALLLPAGNTFDCGKTAHFSLSFGYADHTCMLPTSRIFRLV